MCQMIITCIVPYLTKKVKGLISQYSSLVGCLKSGPSGIEYLQFYDFKGQGLVLLPLSGILVHHRFTHRRKFTGACTMRVKTSVLPKNTTQCPQQVFIQAAESGVQHRNHQGGVIRKPVKTIQSRVNLIFSTVMLMFSIV